MEETKTLLQETEDALGREKLSPSDVQWVGSTEFWMDWGEFVRLADGVGEVPGDLVVVGKDWWIDRLGANRGWTLSVQRSAVPEKPERHFIPTTLLGRDTAMAKDAREFFEGRERLTEVESALAGVTARNEDMRQALREVQRTLTESLAVVSRLLDADIPG